MSDAGGPPIDGEPKASSFVRKRRQKDKGQQPTPPDRPKETPPDPPAPDGPRRPERDRIVVPRQERGAGKSPLDVELREVRRGASSRGVYLRVVPSQRRFTRVGEGHIEATRVGSRPVGRVERLLQGLKGTILGSPLATAQSIHERLTKFKALAILGSDPLSSSAYATEEALIILALAGTQGLDYVLPIGIVVAALLILVTMSYRQTIKAYPGGGGAYAVSHDNLGRYPGLTAAGALMVDYTLVVSVSVSAGVAAITSAIPELFDYRVPLAVFFIIFFTLGNLRGVRESGTLFAAPTYFFILMMGGTVAAGIFRVIIGDAPGTFTEAAPPTEEVVATQGLTLWLVLRAFSSGASALTGVETIANGTPMFKKPESDNARITLTIMAAIAVYLFIGITFVVSRFGLVPSHDETLVSSLGRSVLGGENVIYFMFQAATAMILFLAANSAFNAFPLLGALLAKDKYLPRQFSFRGDRLAFSNGILLLALIAIVLVIVFDASVTNLIPLYAVGVFIAFSLSQLGMVKRWWIRREPGWQGSMALNLVGLTCTAAVAVIIGLTKFTHGAWISLVMVAIMIIIFSIIRRHYDWYERIIHVNKDELQRVMPTAQAMEERARRQHIIVPVDGLNKIAIGAVDFARVISSNVTAVHLADNRDEAEAFREEWEGAMPDVPLLIIESPYRAFAGPMIAYIESLERTEGDDAITVVLPGFKAYHWWEGLLHNQAIRRLRPFLEAHEAIRVVDFDFDVRDPATA
ncbi:MAG TPA: APC family permease [Dehalococcoidia bacterium]|nr:APC family permease [Dehalococcoidia bacterium]